MYEFVDKDRFDVQEIYWNFLEKEEEDIAKSIKALKAMIKKDPDFFDPYIVLADYYYADRQEKAAFELTREGYNRAMKLLLKRGKFPDELSWLYTENRHIIRMLFNYAMLMWEVEEKEEALRIFQQLLGSNPNDNIGARYAIVALLEGMASMQEHEEMFATKEGYLDGAKVEAWFEKAARKHLDEIGWWLEMDDEI